MTHNRVKLKYLVSIKLAWPKSNIRANNEAAMLRYPSKSSIFLQKI